MNRTEISNPCENLCSNYKESKYAIIILNTCLNFHPSFLLPLWTQAEVRVTVDGGTERWLSWLKQHGIDDVSLPDLITGDMDSLSTDTLDFIVSNKMCKVIRTPDQIETDFTKSLRELNRFCVSQHSQIEVVYVIAESSGRFDHILANINTLYKAIDIIKGVKVFLVASNSLTCLLLEGTHVIHIPVKLREKHEWCALIPIGAPSCLTTTGLRWNLDNEKLEFGKLVSSSNTYDDHSSEVTISTDNPVVWSMGIESLLEGDS